MNYAVIKDGEVINIIVINQNNVQHYLDNNVGEELVEIVNNSVAVGDRYENGEFIKVDEQK